MSGVGVKRRVLVITTVAGILFALLVAFFVVNMRSGSTANTDGDVMMRHIQRQLDFGPRHIGAPGHERAADWITASSRSAVGTAGKVSEQRWQETGANGRTYQLRNVIASLYPDNPRRIVVGTHYDSKSVADKDPENPEAPVPGANDSASGTAVLLHAARQLASDPERPAVGVDFVFFDGEEGLPGAGSKSAAWETLGSNHFARNLGSAYPSQKPEGGIVIDMVCDRNLGIMQDASSRAAAPEQVRRFWDIGNQVTPGAFLPPTNASVIDDHTALNAAGIPSFVVIDFDYPWHHTTKDTIDKCSPDSLETVFNTLVKYIRSI